MTSPKRKRDILIEIKDRMFRSRFFAISALFHAFLITVLGTAVLMNHVPEPPDFTAGEGDGNGFVQGDPNVNTPPPPPTEQVKMDTPTPNNSNAMDVIAVDNAAMAPKLVMPTMSAPVAITPSESKPKMAAAAPPRSSHELSANQAKRIRAFTGSWAKGSGNRWGGTGAVKDREFEFTAYLAKYSGGDWASTNNIAPTGEIWRGSLLNLISFVNTFSKGRIKASSQPVPLDLSKWDEEIAVKKPPFIFFTGHRDFKLTDKEVAALQEYVQSGGCIWGDSSLPGLRSRFDLAFRREMRRVIPDVDKDWEILKSDYPIYSKNPYYPEIKSPPPGINGYKEQIYALRYGGEVAIIYTPNDYGDMWRIALDKDMKIDRTILERTRATLKYTDDSVLYRGDIYYRGLDVARVIDAYKFGTNIVIHLLTRWEDRIKNVPAGL